MAWNYSNTATETTLSGSINGAVGSMTVVSTSGFPTSYPYTLILEHGTANEEIVNVTNAVATTLTITRGQDGTAAVSHTSGVSVIHGIVARDVSEPQNHIAASTNVHGLSGGSAVVGTSQSQTLTNKTISGASNTLTNIPAANVTGTFASIASGNITSTGTVAGVDVTASGDMSVGDDLTVTDAISSASLATTGNVSVGGNLTVTGTAVFFRTVTTNVYTSNDTWTKPADAKYVFVEAVGGGGGGGGVAATGPTTAAVAGGGAGGGYGRKWFTASDLSATESVTVGAGGAGGAAGNNNGSAGGNSTFDTLAAAGGGAGTGMASGSTDAYAAGGAGNTGSGGDINIGGSDGITGIRIVNSVVQVAQQGHGGGSFFGSMQRAGSNVLGNAGNPGGVYGSGGSGAHNGNSQSAQAGGDGAAGVVIVVTYS